MARHGGSRAVKPLLLLLVVLCQAALAAGEHEAMLDDIRRSMKEAASYTGRDELRDSTMQALAAVPREAFVAEAQRPMAHLNRPLPIGEGQTISQPFIVALMTDLLEPEPDHIVLEVGTGSGYQAAVLAQLVKHVYSIEIIPTLAERARKTLERLGYRNVTIRTGDGYAGWPEHAPFDGIIVTAAPEEIPAPLLAQLKPGGRLILPVGPEYGFQQLLLVEKDASGDISKHSVLPVAFVPLTGDR
jgi:protein-L-isoaspartate(D-aspartate) O-methyltransferase